MEEEEPVSDDETSVFFHANINYIDEATRQTHLNYKKNQEHPNTRPKDIISAEMSQAAYVDHIKNPDIMKDFINRVSRAGMEVAF